MYQSIFKMMLNAERCSVLPGSTVPLKRIFFLHKLLASSFFTGKAFLPVPVPVMQVAFRYSTVNESFAGTYSDLQYIL